MRSRYRDDANVVRRTAPIERLRQLARSLGPGVITGAADDDPSGISTYAIAGASAGYSMLWIALVTLPMMVVVQGMCARIAICSGSGLVAVMRERFAAPVVRLIVVAVVVANTFNLGADLAGMAAALHLLVPLPVPLAVLAFGTLVAVVEVFASYRAFAHVLKWLCLSLFSYVATAFIVRPDWLVILRHALVPEVRIESWWLLTFVGFLGTTITPYLFFWQAALVVEEERAHERRFGEAPYGRRRPIATSRLDTVAGMIFSNVVTFFIVVTTAATLGAHGRHEIASAQDAAEALRPLAGDATYALFALGIVGTGLLAVPVLAGSSAYVLADAFGFHGGLDAKPARAKRFYAVVIAGIGAGALMGLLGVDPIRALLWSAVLNGVTAVPLLAAITLLASDRRVMGRYTNTRTATVWAWTTVVFMALAATAMFVPWPHA